MNIADDIKNIVKTWNTPNCYSGNFSDVPNKCGVYMIIRTELNNVINCSYNRSILYIGSSKNLRTRYMGHDILKTVKILLSNDHIGFYFMITDDYKTIEKQLIKQYNPLINSHYNG